VIWSTGLTLTLWIIFYSTTYWNGCIFYQPTSWTKTTC